MCFEGIAKISARLVTGLLRGSAGLFLLFGIGCAPPEEIAEGASERVFEVRGWIRSIPAERETITIAHQEIPEYMPAMTMPFNLKDPSLADGLEAGDPVVFRFVVGERDSWIDRIRKLDGPEAAAMPSRDVRRSDPLLARIPRLEEGDLTPSFQLVDQDGKRFDLADFRGSAVVVTFIFTRCPVPDFCPLMSQKFQALQQRLNEDPLLRDRAHLLSVTIDPEFDTPEVLRAYADVYTDSTENWTFATGDPGRIEEMTTRFSIFIDPESKEGTLDHALGTALIGPDSRLMTVWRGNRWTVDEVTEAISTTLKEQT